jgi:hypothetical protein
MDSEIIDDDPPEPESDESSTCSACGGSFPTRAGLVVSSPLDDTSRVVEWRYCSACAQRGYGVLFSLLKARTDCPHYDDDRDTGEAHFGVFGWGAEIFVCEECLPVR